MANKQHYPNMVIDVKNTPLQRSYPGVSDIYFIDPKGLDTLFKEYKVPFTSKIDVPVPVTVYPDRSLLPFGDRLASFFAGRQTQPCQLVGFDNGNAVLRNERKVFKVSAAAGKQGYAIRKEEIEKLLSAIPEMAVASVVLAVLRDSYAPTGMADICREHREIISKLHASGRLSDEDIVNLDSILERDMKRQAIDFLHMKTNEGGMYQELCNSLLSCTRTEGGKKHEDFVTLEFFFVSRVIDKAVTTSDIRKLFDVMVHTMTDSVKMETPMPADYLYKNEDADVEHDIMPVLDARKKAALVLSSLFRHVDYEAKTARENLERCYRGYLHAGFEDIFDYAYPDGYQKKAERLAYDAEAVRIMKERLLEKKSLQGVTEAVANIDSKEIEAVAEEIDRLVSGSSEGMKQVVMAIATAERTMTAPDSRQLYEEINTISRDDLFKGMTKEERKEILRQFSFANRYDGHFEVKSSDGHVVKFIVAQDPEHSNAFKREFCDLVNEFISGRTSPDAGNTHLVINVADCYGFFSPIAPSDDIPHKITEAEISEMSLGRGVWLEREDGSGKDYVVYDVVTGMIHLATPYEDLVKDHLKIMEERKEAKEAKRAKTESRTTEKQHGIK